MDWRPNIVQMMHIKAAVAAADRKGLWEYHLPAVAAADQAIHQAEQHLGGRIDESYRAFLGYADGWPAIYHDVDLFGTRQLMEGAGRDMLGFLEPLVLADAGIGRGQALPIAASRDDLDLFVLADTPGPNPSPVLWFAGSLVDRFSDFEECFLALADYNRLTLQRLLAE